MGRARASIGEHPGRAATLHWVDRIEATIAEALDHDRRLERALAEIDPERVEHELKTALRDKHDHTAADSELITTLRRRHEMVHGMIDRRESIAAQIATTLADLETLAARTVVGTVDESVFGDDLRRLADDVTALEEARQEIADL